MFIQTEALEHPESMKFLPGRPVMASGAANFSSAQSAKRSPLARRLFEIDSVDMVIQQRLDCLALGRIQAGFWYGVAIVPDGFDLGGIVPKHVLDVADHAGGTTFMSHP